jgi:hypothetical protein
LYSALSAIVIVHAIHGSTPKNALKLPFENEVDTVVFLPEAWAFFTRNAQRDCGRLGPYSWRDPHRVTHLDAAPPPADSAMKGARFSPRAGFAVDSSGALAPLPLWQIDDAVRRNA